MQNINPFQAYSYILDNSTNISAHTFHLYPEQNVTNKYVYVKQEPSKPKVLINPHFGKRVFINPNFNPKAVITNPPQKNKIHVNPNILNMHHSRSNNGLKLHCPDPDAKKSKMEVDSQTTKAIFQSRTKLVLRQSKEQQVFDDLKSSNIANKRCIPTIRSAYKIVKSSLHHYPNRDSSQRKSKSTFRSRYKLVKTKSPSQFSKAWNLQKFKSPKNNFKLDNRLTIQKMISPKSKKFIYINKLMSTSDLARTIPPKRTKNLSVINIGGTLYKKSHNSLRRASMDKKRKEKKDIIQRRSIIKSKYKFVRRSQCSAGHNLSIKCKRKIKPRLSKSKMRIQSSEKMRKCNIPCPYYRKFGKCKGEKNGKCYRKHDPDQIALCTKFLQGACIDEKCLLSHNISPEKMPTCKFYLEGICAKDNCPYLHVKISMKADICRDFLEGFCKLAAKCDKRHQLLCPDFEKNGSCPKQRCPYPHGRMQRKYSVIDKHKFVKKSSQNAKSEKKIENIETFSKVEINTLAESTESTRYYTKQKNSADISATAPDTDQSDESGACDNNIGFRSRPKLGALPSFIAFKES